MPPKPKVDHLVDPPMFPRAAQAIIWRNTFDRLGLPTQHFGHAALQLYEDGERETFISWWPSPDGSGKFTAGAKGTALTRKIDAAVAAYDKVRASQDTFKKYGALAGIMVQIMNHRRQEPDSARTGAVIELGGQVLYKVDEFIRSDWGSTWHEDMVNLEARFRALKEPTEIS